ncbi:MAG: NADAR family protein [Patescibacteria group bacterium]
MEGTFPLEKFYIYFSPYTAHAIEIEGVVFPTLEHAYQCMRYTDPVIIEEIRQAHSPLKAWEISSTYKHLQVPEFKNEEHKLKVMKMLMRLKADQHEEIRNALRDSGDLTIVKHIVTYPPGDGFWDDGEDGAGLNHTGRLWMEIRDELGGSNNDGKLHIL